jgi:hypothetical protein
MKLINRKLIIAIIVCLLFFIPTVKAIGISPSERKVIVQRGEEGVAYFAISIGPREAQIINMSTNVNWVEFEPESFKLEPLSLEYVKVKIRPLEIGEYFALIKASAYIPGQVAMVDSVSAKLYVSATPPVIPTATKETLKTEVQEAIKKAQDMISEAKRLGADTSLPESILAKALEEFDKEDYMRALDDADEAYRIALELYNEKMKPLIPIQTILLVIILGASVVTVIMVFEIYRASRRKAVKGPIAKGVKCPKCGKDMAVVYKGSLIVGYVCLKCKHLELKLKEGST